jgi:hypothetical protein
MAIHTLYIAGPESRLARGFWNVPDPIRQGKWEPLWQPATFYAATTPADARLLVFNTVDPCSVFGGLLDFASAEGIGKLVTLAFEVIFDHRNVLDATKLSQELLREIMRPGHYEESHRLVLQAVSDGKLYLKIPGPSFDLASPPATPPVIVGLYGGDNQPTMEQLPKLRIHDVWDLSARWGHRRRSA